MARILIVEDDAAQGTLIELMLARGRLSSKTVTSAESAMALLAHDADFNLVLTDIRMPGMDGHDFVVAVRQLYPHLPILAMTVHSGSSWIDQALANGAVGCLVKPFSASELADAIHDALERYGQPLT